MGAEVIIGWASLVVSVLALLYKLGLIRVRGPGSRRIPLFLCDASGKPRLGVTLVGPDGSTKYPDQRGLMNIPQAWTGLPLSVRNTEHEEIATVTIAPDQGTDGTFRCTLS